MIGGVILLIIISCFHFYAVEDKLDKIINLLEKEPKNEEGL